MIKGLAAVLVASAIAVYACKDRASCAPAAVNAQFLLVVPYYTLVGDVRSSKSVLLYKIDAVTGAPIRVAGSPLAAGSEPMVTGVAGSSRFAYVINKQSNNVSAYKIDARTGALTHVPGSPFALDPSGDRPNEIVVDPAGRHVYVASNAGISAFAVDAASGALTPVRGSPFAATMSGAMSDGFGTASIAIDRSDKFAYVLNYDRNTVSSYAIDAAGALKLAGSPVNANQNRNAFEIGTIKIDPQGKFAYVTASCCVYVYAVDASTGALTPSAHLSLGEPGVFALSGFAVHPTGKFAYAADNSRIYSYSIDATTGRLKATGGPKFRTSAGNDPFGLTIDPTGTFAYAFNPGSDTTGMKIYAYRIDGANGQLTPLPRSPFTVAAGLSDPVARWFDAGRCATLRAVGSSGKPPPLARRSSNLVLGQVITAGSFYYYDPKRRFALHYPKGDSGGTITLQQTGPPPAGVLRRDLSSVRTASGIRLGSRAESVVRMLGHPKILRACNDQVYVYLKDGPQEPFTIQFTVHSGIVTAISEELGG